jgi:glycerophosphoryl diester phosphodiesterase
VTEARIETGGVRAFSARGARALMMTFLNPRTALLALLASFSLSACSIHTAPVTPNTVCVPSAHRGDRSTGADNSEEAIRSALKKQIPFIEVDVRRTASNHSVIFHDRTVKESNSESTRELHGRTVESLKTTDLPHFKHPDGSPILTLPEALALFTDATSRVQLDIKPDTVEHLQYVISVLVRDPRYLKQAIVQCQSLDCIEYVHHRNLNISVLARVFSPEQLEKVHFFRPAIVQVDPALLSPGLTKAVHSYGGLVLVKTLDGFFDTVESWRKVCNAGADIVLTDHPLEFIVAIARSEGR